MKLVAAKCPSCGANIEVDKHSDSTQCEYCNSKILVDDAIAKYKLEISGEVEIKNIPKLDNYLKLGNRHYEDCEYEEAYNAYSKAIELDPDNYVVILRKGLCKSLCTNYLHFEILPAINGMKNSYSILKKENNYEEIENCTIECLDTVVQLKDFAINFYKKSNPYHSDVEEFIQKLLLCLDGFEYLLSISINLKLKINIIEHIINLIQCILTPKEYDTGMFYPGKSVSIISKYKMNKKLKKELQHKRLQYILEKKILEKELQTQLEEQTDDKEKISDKEKIKKDKKVNEHHKININKHLTSTLTTTSAFVLKYTSGIMIFFASFMILGSIVYVSFVSLIAWVWVLTLFIPKTNKWFVKKFEGKPKGLLILKIASIFIALFLFGLTIHYPYEGTWISNDMTISLDKTNIIITLKDQTKIEGTYTYETINPNNYIIKSDIYNKQNNIKNYKFKYIKENNTITFCLLKNDNCSIYFVPEKQDSNYKYKTN